jgi:chromosome segregation ATPase
MPAVLGGLVAAGLGFGAATYLGQQPSDEPNPLEASLAAQDQRLSGLETKIGEIAAAVTASDGASADAMNAQLSALTEQLQGQFGQVASQLEAIVGTVGGVESSLSGAIGNVQSGLGDVGGRLAAIDERLTAVEKRPLQESSETAKAAFAAYERELEELKQTLSQAHALNDEVNQEMSARAEATQAEMAEVTAQAEALQAEAEARAAEAAAQAEAKANAAAAREALASLDGALERGTGYATPLAILAAITEEPEALSGAADGGVTSLPELRRAYPEQARAALDASIRNTVADDASGRIMAFLRTQSGVRSLAPRDGDDPDAVLSRAEAALNAADLETTLAELAQLPPAGQEAMADWVAQAQQRLEVTQAASALATTLLAN